MTLDPRESAHDGREGWVCEDCGAYLQWVVINAQEMLRCPWANPPDWSIYSYHVVTHIYCRRPLTGRLAGGMRTNPEVA